MRFRGKSKRAGFATEGKDSFTSWVLLTKLKLIDKILKEKIESSIKYRVLVDAPRNYHSNGTEISFSRKIRFSPESH